MVLGEDVSASDPMPPFRASVMVTYQISKETYRMAMPLGRVMPSQEASLKLSRARKGLLELRNLTCNLFKLISTETK